MSTHIGYYNDNEYPVSWTRQKRGQGPMDLEAGQPITDDRGFLVKPCEELDALVSQGLIAKATSDMKNFAEWDAVRARQLGTTIQKVQGDGQVVPQPPSNVQAAPQPSRNATAQQEIPTATVSATKGIEEGSTVPGSDGKVEESETDALPEGVEKREDGSYHYKGITFDSEDGLRTYLAYEEAERG